MTKSRLKIFMGFNEQHRPVNVRADYKKYSDFVEQIHITKSPNKI